MPPAINVRRLKSPSSAERSEIKRIILHALNQAPSWEFLTKNDLAVQEAMAEDILDAGLDYGEVWVAGAGSTLEGAAIWFGPGKEYNLFWRETFEHILPTDTKDWIKRHASSKYSELYSNSYPAGPSERINSWQLLVLSVSPTSRRRGLGRSLIEAKAAQVTEPLTTDVDTTAALLFFEKLKFMHKGVKNFSSGVSRGYALWCMRRSPRPGAKAGPRPFT